MKTAISNLAWDCSEKKIAYEILLRNNVEGLEIVPGLFFNTCKDPFKPSQSQVQLAIKEIQTFGLKLVSMQSILYNKVDALLFGNTFQLDLFKSAMNDAIQLANRLEIPNLVFGSPKNRFVPNGMNRNSAFECFEEVFNNLGNLAKKNGTSISVEPIPEEYGNNFLRFHSDTLKIIKKINHPNIKLNIDTGAIILNKEEKDSFKIFNTSTDFIGHVHLSEPNMLPAPQELKNTQKLVDVLRRNFYKAWISIEMKPNSSKNRMLILESCLRRAKKIIENTPN